MAAAVLRPTGSTSTRARDALGSGWCTADSCSALVTVQMRAAGTSGRSLATVCSNIVPLPTMFDSCLGVLVRLRGQNRVPRPPARMTACTGSFSVGIGVTRRSSPKFCLQQFLAYANCYVKHSGPARTYESRKSHLPEVIHSFLG